MAAQYTTHHQHNSMITNQTRAPVDVVVQPPTLEDYIRAADGMGDYLTWDMSEISELPPWYSFDLPGQAP
jgi:hypothetical protein